MSKREKMPKCGTCSNYWFKDWSINKECRLGHDTPDFGDTEACSEYEEQFTIGMKEGWSYEGEQAKEHEEIGDFQEDKRRLEDSDSESSSSMDGNVGYGGISSSSTSRSDGSGTAIGIIIFCGVLAALWFGLQRKTENQADRPESIPSGNIRSDSAVTTINALGIGEPCTCGSHMGSQVGWACTHAHRIAGEWWA